jgi:hypothetical protein
MKKIAGFLILVLAVIAAAFLWSYLSQEARHRRELRLLQEIVTRLKAERRVAQVVARERAADDQGQTWTSVDFIEWDRAGRRLPPVMARLPGSEVYFEALIVKFKDEYVEQGDALRGATLLLFRRIFGSAQAPEAGVPVDSLAEDGIPRIYRVDETPSKFEIDLWKRFWYYAAHPDEADKLGVRVMQCEAVGGRLQPGAVYELSVEARGGLNLVLTTAKSR